MTEYRWYMSQDKKRSLNQMIKLKKYVDELIIIFFNSQIHMLTLLINNVGFIFKLCCENQLKTLAKRISPFRISSIWCLSMALAFTKATIIYESYEILKWTVTEKLYTKNFEKGKNMKRKKIFRPFLNKGSPSSQIRNSLGPSNPHRDEISRQIGVMDKVRKFQMNSDDYRQRTSKTNLFRLSYKYHWV